ncbi:MULTISPECIES: S4 domain-containing protein [unclassified Nonomuraea]|uniref:S4 domain-containing protein n=1 Tax=unclassified Nonomuraea TaxID=2593643 RepID=UPI00340F2393
MLKDRELGVCDPRPAWRGRARITRSIASDACRGRHVRVNGVRVRPSHAVRGGDEVRLRHEGHERIVAVSRIITERVGATAAHPGRLPAPSPQATETRHG